MNHIKIMLNLVNAIALLSFILFVSSSHAALSMNLSRVIVNEGDKSNSISLINNNTRSPYLAQAWIENAAGEKVQDMVLVTPPLQRIEGGGKSQIRLQSLPKLSNLPQDKETLFYLNLREVPPKSSKANTLQLAIQTRLKLFYRPHSLKIDSQMTVAPDMRLLKISKENGRLVLDNQTPYHITFIGGKLSTSSKDIDKFEPLMLTPYGKEYLPDSLTKLGVAPQLVFVDDYGGKKTLRFNCKDDLCTGLDILNK